MRISAKGRYALAAVVEIARQSGEGEYVVTAVSVSKSLGISKIFLEQVLAHLKSSGLLTSTKGSGGGYRLSRKPEQITVWNVLHAAETALFEKTESTVADNSPAIDTALKTLVFDKLDETLQAGLRQVTMRELLDFSEHQRAEQAFMLYM